MARTLKSTYVFPDTLMINRLSRAKCARCANLALANPKLALAPFMEFDDVSSNTSHEPHPMLNYQSTSVAVLDQAPEPRHVCLAHMFSCALRNTVCA